MPISLNAIAAYFGILKKTSMAENPLAVQGMLVRLNQIQYQIDHPGTATPPTGAPVVWQAIPGYFALTFFDFNKGKGAPIFNANFGVPIKVFQNTQTGEIKTFSAYIFETN